MSSHDELWDDGDSNTSVINSIDSGTNFGRGRGFVPLKQTSHDTTKIGYKNGSYDEDNDFSTSYDNRDNSKFEFKGRGHGRGRGEGRDGRGRGRGRGGRGGRGGTSRLSDDNQHTRGSMHQRKAGDTNSGRGRMNKENGDNEKPREVYIPPDPTDDEEIMFAGGITSGMNFNNYDNIHVKVTGENAPSPIEHFENSGLRELLLNNIKKSGYTRPTPVQKNAIPIIMAGRDLMACAQTGSGKTAAFLLPLINLLISDPKVLVASGKHCEPHAVIISPTRELTLQIFNEARKFSHNSVIKTVVTYGGASSYHQSKQVMNGCHVLVATPGRLLDFVDKGKISFASLRFLVLDEADRMLDMGFMPDIERMMAHPSMVDTGERQTLMFSATFPEDIQRLAGKFLHNYLFLAIGIVGSACSDVEQKFYLVSKFEKRPKLTELMALEGGEKTLVFVEQKRTADFIAAFLSERDFPTTSIHGDRLQREREEALADFKSGNMSVLVATAVAARGLDIKNVSHVVNFDLPKSIDEYVHRIGRTGRVGNRGKATSFYDPEVDAPLARDLVKILQQAEQEVPPWLEKDAANTSAHSSYTRQGRFGGKDFRKFENKVNDSFTVTSDTNNYGPPPSTETEEQW
ncbi:ATP-dependent RNA helicase vasa [Blattella germanica]|nr:ATP-dependent RNA helicase vasa [Blattella germanica]